MATIVTRSGKGSPLTHAEVDANFTNLNTDKLELSGGTMTGNLSFGDNDKAIFGAGSDLQIYHDGSASYIHDNGTGDLNLAMESGSKIVIQSGTSGNHIAEFNHNGAAELMHNGNQKLATTATGIDVTGTVTADGLTMDTSANSVYTIELGADRTSASQALGIIKGSWNNTVVAQINLAAGDDTTNKDNGRIFLRTASAGSTANRLQVAENGDISFYEDTGTTAKFFWDASAESLGIGTSSPSESLTNRGNIFIETNSTSANSGNGLFWQSTTSGWSTSTAHAAIYGKRTDASNGYLRFDTRQSGTTQEAMRISSGNLLVGRTSSGSTGNGHSIQGGDSAIFSRDASGETMAVCRNDSTGDLIRFRRNGVICGEIVNTGSTSVAYNTSSDYRLKENVTDVTDGITRVKQLAPKRFNFIADGADRIVDGFLAHEAATVVPEAVTGTKDELEVWKYDEDLPEGVSVGDNKLDDDGNTIPKMQGIDQAKLVPLLTAALQEAIAKIETLEARITALEGA